MIDRLMQEHIPEDYAEEAETTLLWCLFCSSNHGMAVQRCFGWINRLPITAGSRHFLHMQPGS